MSMDDTTPTQRIWARYAVEGIVEIVVPASADLDEIKRLAQEAVKKDADYLPINIVDWGPSA